MSRRQYRHNIGVLHVHDYSEDERWSLWTNKTRASVWNCLVFYTVGANESTELGKERSSRRCYFNSGGLCICTESRGRILNQSGFDIFPFPPPPVFSLSDVDIYSGICWIGQCPNHLGGFQIKKRNLFYFPFWWFLLRLQQFSDPYYCSLAKNCLTSLITIVR